MAKINRYGGNLQAFGSEAQGTERTVFGDTTQDDTLDANITTEFLRGWGIVGVNENPTKQDFNALGYTVSQLVAYLHQAGVPEWHVEQEYFEGAVTITQAGVYRSLVDGNIGNDPDTDDGSNWLQLVTTADAGDIETLSDLQAVDVSNVQNTVYMQGRSSADDGAGGRFLWDSSDLSAEVASDEVTANEGDGGIYVAPDSDKTGTSGAWVRQYSGLADVRWWGAKGDGSTDDTTALQTAIDSAGVGSNRGLFLPNGDYMVTSALTCENRGQRVIGEGRDQTVIKASGTAFNALLILKQKYIDFDSIRFDGDSITTNCVAFNSGGQSQLVDCETRNAVEDGVIFHTGYDDTGGNNNLARLVRHDSRTNGRHGVMVVHAPQAAGGSAETPDDSQGIEFLSLNSTGNTEDGLHLQDGNASQRVVNGLYEGNGGWGINAEPPSTNTNKTHHIYIAPWIEGNILGNIRGYGDLTNALNAGHWGALEVKSLNGGEPAVRNRFINATFKVAQGGTSATFGSASHFCDIWRLRLPAGAVGSVDRVETGTAEDKGGARYAMEVTISDFDGSTVRVVQRLEDVHTLAGRGVVLGFWGETSDSNEIMNVGYVQHFGSGGSANVGGNQNLGIPASWGQVWAELDIPNIDGKTVGDGSYLEIQFNFPSSMATGSYRIASPFLMPGKNPPVMYDDVPYEDEVRRVQRYYETGRARNTVLNGTGSSQSGFSFTVPFATRKRSSPSISSTTQGGEQNVSANSTENATESEFMFTFTADNANVCRIDRDWEADARL